MSAREGEALTCRELIDLLADYLAYLNTYRSAKTLAARAGSVEMPAEMRRRLSEFLVRHLSP